MFTAATDTPVVSQVPKPKSRKVAQRLPSLSPSAAPVYRSDNWNQTRLPASTLQDYADDCCQLRRRPGTDRDFVAMRAEEERERAEWLASAECLATSTDSYELTSAYTEAETEERRTWSKLDNPTFSSAR